MVVMVIDSLVVAGGNMVEWSSGDGHRIEGDMVDGHGGWAW